VKNLFEFLGRHFLPNIDIFGDACDCRQCSFEHRLGEGRQSVMRLRRELPRGRYHITFHPVSALHRFGPRLDEDVAIGLLESLVEKRVLRPPLREGRCADEACKFA
jgi:hypothetical protein